MRGPGFANLDLSVQRQFMMTGRVSLQARAEIFNLTNTAHFDIPATANRSVSNLVLNPDGTIRNFGGFATITSYERDGFSRAKRAMAASRAAGTA